MLKCGHVHHFKKHDKRPEFENVRNFPIPKCICGFKGTLRNLEYSFLSEYPWATLIKFSGKMGGTIAKQGLYDIMHGHPNWELYLDTMAYRTYGYADRSFSLTFWIFYFAVAERGKIYRPRTLGIKEAPSEAMGLEKKQATCKTQCHSGLLMELSSSQGSDSHVVWYWGS